MITFVDTISGNTFVQTGEALGTNRGGFFTSTDHQTYYCKYDVDEPLNRDKFKNEYLAIKLYQLFGVNVPGAELITFVGEDGQKLFGIKTKIINQCIRTL